MHLSTALKSAGHEVRVAVVSAEDPVAVAKAWRPGILAYSVWTGGQRYYYDINNLIRKEIGAFSVFGGPHATFFPEMIAEPGVDAVCVGEGEEALVDLANIWIMVPSIPICPIGGSTMTARSYRNPVRSYATDLDGLGLPDRAIIYDKDQVIRTARQTIYQWERLPIRLRLLLQSCPG